MRRIARLPKPVAGPTETATRHFHCVYRPSPRPSHAATASSPSPLGRPATAAAQPWGPPQLPAHHRRLATSAARRQPPANSSQRHEDAAATTTGGLEAQQQQGEEEQQAEAVGQRERKRRPSEKLLAVPGGYRTAPRPNSISDPSYEPAESGEGLEEVGGLDGWWEDDAHWNPAVEVRGFGPRTPVADRGVLEVLARRAVLEALAVQQSVLAGGAEGAADSSSSLTAAVWSRGGAHAQDAALALQVEVAADGSVSGVRGDVAAVVEGLLPSGGAAAAAAAAAEEAPTLGAAEASELVATWAEDPAWKGISLRDPALKFAITKRILQLTGHLLPDFQLANAHTVGDLVSVLIRPPKAKKLAEELAADGTLASLPNVSVYGRRVTPIDKHKMVGRWKVIVEELEKRGLPVTGTGGYGKAVERKWAFR